MIPPAVEYVAKLASGTALLIAYAATGRVMMAWFGIPLIIEPVLATYIAAYVASRPARSQSPDEF